MYIRYDMLFLGGYLHQFIIGALLDDLTACNYDDLIRHVEILQLMCHEDARLSCELFHDAVFKYGPANVCIHCRQWVILFDIKYTI